MHNHIQASSLRVYIRLWEVENAHGVIFSWYAGPVASVLVTKLGCRFTEIFGGALLLLGVGLSVLSRDLWHAIVLYSVVAGNKHILL